MNKKLKTLFAIITVLSIQNLSAYTWHFKNYTPWICNYKLDIVAGKDKEGTINSGDSASRGVLGYLTRRVEVKIFIGGQMVTLEAKHSGAGAGWVGHRVLIGVKPQLKSGSYFDIDGYKPFIVVGDNEPVLGNLIRKSDLPKMQQGANASANSSAVANTQNN